MSTLPTLNICLILQVCLFIAGAPDLSYSQDQMSLEHTPELAPPSITLQIDQVLEFSDAKDQPVELTPGTYQLISTPSNNLQFISTITKEPSVVRATTFRHAEPLSTPSTLLIQDEDAEERFHLLLFFPDGQGWDAEGWVAGLVRSRGGNFDAISSFSPKRRYTGVILQQGRVTTDADLNEQDAVSSSAMSRLHSNVTPFYGRVTLEQGRIQLDTHARQSLHRKCRFCAKKQ